MALSSSYPFHRADQGHNSWMLPLLADTSGEVDQALAVDFDFSSADNRQHRVAYPDEAPNILPALYAFADEDEDCISAICQTLSSNSRSSSAQDLAIHVMVLTYQTIDMFLVNHIMKQRSHGSLVRRPGIL
uniref:Uncharacterized protein n=1 Tax=Fagus sylvatica TaxID=28930 RepID=A0A2N9G694_FAGSY